MPFNDLPSFVSFLEAKGDLHRIRVPVDPVLEITEITQRVLARRGPALLFEKVIGSPFPALINVFGAERRMAWALGAEPERIGAQLGELAGRLPQPTVSNLWAARGGLRRVLSGRRRRGRALFRDRQIHPPDLGMLPVAQSWPKDAGRFLTLPLVITRGPEDGRYNMGIYRMQVFGADATGMHWQIGKGGGYHHAQAVARGENLPLAAVIGADPILMFCGMVPLPEGIDEVAFAGVLRGRPTAVAALPNGLSVPARSEFVLEGFVPPEETRLEGPYGDHFGHYSQQAPFPVFHVERIWHRAAPIFPLAVVGRPPQEDQVMGDAVQELLLPLLKIMRPEVVDLWAYMEAGFHNLLVISARQRFEKEAVKTGLWALGEGQMALTKVVILVDPEVNPRDVGAVLRAVRAHFDPREDFLLLPKTSQDTLDFTGPKMNRGSKMVLDATRGPRAPTAGAASGAGVAASADLGRLRAAAPRIRAARLWENALLVLQVEGEGRAVLETVAAMPGMEKVPLIAAVSTDVPIADDVLLLWGVFTRFDCARDTFFPTVRLVRGHPVYEGPLCIDATWKPGYPDPLTMDGAVIDLVNRRWREYGFSD